MPKPPNEVELSIIIPMFNEEANIDYLFERLMSVLDPMHTSYEIVCINDGSRDNTLQCLIAHHQKNPTIKVIDLSRNFGKEVALTAGIDYAKGEGIIPIDADLQDPPELIQELVSKWREGYDVVYATRRTRQGESWLKKFTANAFYRVISGISQVPIPADTGDFRLIDRQVVDSLKQMPERTRFMKGLFAWVGYRQTSIYFDRPQRYKGNTKWNYWKLWNFAIDGIASFSVAPLKVWSYVGLAISLVAFVYAAFLFLRTLILGIDVPGYASLMVALLFMGGMQLVTLGVLGEYIGRIYEEVKGRPLYLVRNCYGFLPNSASTNQISETDMENSIINNSHY
ncbi:glycosyltransferase family 2 protein [Trichormus variabilis]|uniref:Bactoprenol glucosyl transferase n=1 Tax=Trichormus variabilis SAG 1403-4b TaxID=447716 RepID=A0A433UP98_ANAVA|nr:glycosyltransferase family 2 protein [Trichormus variabilis]MBD2626543.1 glycosyltransferase family 2 protein [Trichormus variabilis FACHB-164]RUS95665.1 bactoprenol glucosyl transferase [Trichormus variabilis SAG 1403-4b]